MKRKCIWRLSEDDWNFRQSKNKIEEFADGRGAFIVSGFVLKVANDGMELTGWQTTAAVKSWDHGEPPLLRHHFLAVD